VNICSIVNGKRRDGGIFEEVKFRDQLYQLFPEAKLALFASNEKNGPYGDGIGRATQAKLDVSTFKPVRENEGKYNLYRYLVAENHWHLKQILNKYVRENEAKVYQSSNPHFSG